MEREIDSIECECDVYIKCECDGCMECDTRVILTASAIE